MAVNYDRGARRAYRSLLMGTAAMAPGFDTPIFHVVDPGADLESPEIHPDGVPTRQRQRAKKRLIAKEAKKATMRQTITFS